MTNKKQTVKRNAQKRKSALITKLEEQLKQLEGKGIERTMIFKKLNDEVRFLFNAAKHKKVLQAIIWLEERFPDMLDKDARSALDYYRTESGFNVRKQQGLDIVNEMAERLELLKQKGTEEVYQFLGMHAIILNRYGDGEYDNVIKAIDWLNKTFPGVSNEWKGNLYSLRSFANRLSGRLADAMADINKAIDAEPLEFYLSERTNLMKQATEKERLRDLNDDQRTEGDSDFEEEDFDQHRGR
ncbi:MAG: hypothetical protein ACLQQ4_15205 [Bacteroidia bacterium]